MNVDDELVLATGEIIPLGPLSRYGSALGLALSAYERRAMMATGQWTRACRELAEYDLFSQLELSKIFERSPSSIRALGIRTHKGRRKATGKFDPEGLRVLIIAIQHEARTGKLEPKHFLLAETVGISASVSARLLGLQRKEVISLISIAKRRSNGIGPSVRHESSYTRRYLYREEGI